MGLESKAIPTINALVRYELPGGLGILKFVVPQGWVGARPDGAEAAWIDPDPTDEIAGNVVLKIRAYPLSDDPETLLGEFLSETLKTVGVVPSELVVESPRLRYFECDTTIQGLALRQDHAILYAEGKGNSYVITVTETRSRGAHSVANIAAVELLPNSESEQLVGR